MKGVEPAGGGPFLLLALSVLSVHFAPLFSLLNFCSVLYFPSPPFLFCLPIPSYLLPLLGAIFSK